MKDNYLPIQQTLSFQNLANRTTLLSQQKTLENHFLYNYYNYHIKLNNGVQLLQNSYDTLYCNIKLLYILQDSKTIFLYKHWQQSVQ